MDKSNSDKEMDKKNESKKLSHKNANKEVKDFVYKKITISSAIIEIFIKHLNIISLVLIYLHSLQFMNLVNFSKLFV